MTQTHADAPVAARRRPGYGAQWLLVARLLVAEALRSLLITTAVMLAVVLVGSVVARWRGWQLIASSDLDGLILEVAADDEVVTIVTSVLLVPTTVGIAALVMAIVLAARSRVLIAAGATRASVAIGNLVGVAVMTAYVLLLTAVVMVVVGGGVGGGVGRAAELFGAESTGDLAVLAVRGLGAVLGALVLGATITTVFLRWPWWVGALVLPAAAFVVSLLADRAWPGFADTVGQALDRPGFHLAAAVVTAWVYWLIMRRVPVP